jgi:hypothetical protein
VFLCCLVPHQCQGIDPHCVALAHRIAVKSHQTDAKHPLRWRGCRHKRTYCGPTGHPLRAARARARCARARDMLKKHPAR